MLPASLTKAGKLVNGWHPQIAEAAAEVEEVQLPKAPANRGLDSDERAFRCICFVSPSWFERIALWARACRLNSFLCLYRLIPIFGKTF